MLKGPQGAMPHLQMMHKIGDGDKLDQHRDKFQPVRELTPVKVPKSALVIEVEVFSPVAGFILLEDSQGSIWLAEKIRDATTS